MKNNKRTIALFLVLIVVSWTLEIVAGVTLLRWWWTTPWYAGERPGWPPLVVVIVRYGAAHGDAWTPDGVLRVISGIFVGFYVVHAVWNGLLRPVWQRWRLGARCPTEQEERRFETAYATIVRQTHELLASPRWLIAEGPGLDMRWVGYILVVDRELVAHRYFIPLLAHQLAHANSEDRLARRLYAMLAPVPLVGGLFCGWPFAVGHLLTFPVWMLYFRRRVFAADAFAIALGQGGGLMRALEEIYIRVDPSTRGGRVLKPIPYVAERIGRIRSLLLTQRPQGAPRII